MLDGGVLPSGIERLAPTGCPLGDLSAGRRLHSAVRILSGDIGDAVATALDASGSKSLEVLGADVAGQCLRRGLVDEILVYVLPVLLGDDIHFSSPGVARTDLVPISSTRSGDATILRFRFRVRSQPDQRAG